MVNKITVYIADDHPVFLSGLRMIISTDRSLHIVGESGDGVTAESDIRRLCPDVAVLDINMPERNGFDILRSIQTMPCGTKVIFLTMHDEEATLNTALEIGVNGYLLKDSAVADIVAAIKAVARGDSFVSAKLSNFLVNRSSQQKRSANSIDILTPSERRILLLIAEGKTTNQIADELFVSPRTIDRHRYNIGNKLQLRGSSALVVFAVENKQILREISKST